MINELPVFRGGRYSWILSTGFSFLSSKLMAKAAPKMASGWILLTGVMYLPHNQMAKVITQMLLSNLIQPHQHVVQVVKKAVVHHPLVALAQPARPDVDDGIIYKKRLYLHSFKKDYMCSFTGKISCGDGPCQTAQVMIHVASKENPTGIMQSATVLPDGTYQANVSLKEFLHENVDWWIVADSPDSAATQVQGRQILMEDSHISIEEPIQLL